MHSCGFMLIYYNSWYKYSFSVFISIFALPSSKFYVTKYLILQYLLVLFLLLRLDVIPSNQLKINSNSIISCDGSGEPPYFYVNSVFILSGLVLFGLTYSGWFVAKIGCSNQSKMDYILQLIGGFLPILAYFSNHREATRVQWTPPLRESFAYPFFIIQQSFLLGYFGSNQMVNRLSFPYLFNM